MNKTFEQLISEVQEESLQGWDFSYIANRRHSENPPWAFGDTLLQASKNAIRTRYSLINYFYTGLFLVSELGGSFFHPSFFIYPTDNNLINIHNSDHFMLGDALIVHPCLTEGAETVEAYFPTDIWYNWYTGEALKTGLRTVTLSAPIRGFVNIHIRGGYIVPKADDYLTAMTIQDLRYSNITLVLAADGNGNADGQIVFDDGLSIHTISEKRYTLVAYRFSESSSEFKLEVKKLANGYQRQAGEWPYISQFAIYDCISDIEKVTRQSDEATVSVAIGYNRYTKVCWVYLTGVVPDQSEVYTFTLK